MLDRHVLVQEHTKTQRSKVRAPWSCPGITVVIAEHEIASRGGCKLAQRRHVVGEALHRTVDDVSRERDEVGLQRLGDGHHAPHIRRAYRAADVKVADLRDAESIQIFVQVRKMYVDVSNP